MAHAIFRHKVSDYGKWRSVFDEAIKMRRDAGEVSSRIFRIADDPNNILVFQEWDSVDNAAKFVQSTELKEAMQQAGVLEQPDVYFLNEA